MFGPQIKAAMIALTDIRQLLTEIRDLLKERQNA
jgi:hypothetical protein